MLMQSTEQPYISRAIRLHGDAGVPAVPGTLHDNAGARKEEKSNPSAVDEPV